MAKPDQYVLCMVARDDDGQLIEDGHGETMMLPQRLLSTLRRARTMYRNAERDVLTYAEEQEVKLEWRSDQTN